ncbi:MAG: hypothetical protein GY804_02995 [Alphaproteobacteria bacterium]|nr:hypothetical protein [Alphaproteobacteria bacterium]
MNKTETKKLVDETYGKLNSFMATKELNKRKLTEIKIETLKIEASNLELTLQIEDCNKILLEYEMPF